MSNKKHTGPKILCLDIETKPLLIWSWGIGEQHIGLDQIEEDWRIMSFAAKFEHSKDVIQHDLRKGINDKNEKALLKKVWDLLDEADIVVGQNSKRFDIKKLNERFLHFGMGSPSPFRQIDTYVESKKYFSPTSHKLEYRSKQLNEKYKKLSHSKFPGLSLWKECIYGNKEAWVEMATYNVFDVLSTIEYYEILKPWITTVDFNVHTDSTERSCSCGSTSFLKKGYSFTNTGKFQITQCKKCRKYHTSKTNLLSKEKKKALKA